MLAGAGVEVTGVVETLLLPGEGNRKSLSSGNTEMFPGNKIQTEKDRKIWGNLNIEI